MTTPYLISPSGQRDLDEIWLYIAKDNPDAADRVERSILSAMREIGNHPLRGHLREDLSDQNVRFWSVYSYMIIYDPNTKPVHILRVISGYRDVKHTLETE